MIAILFWLCVLVIFYAYILYPALLWILAKLFPVPLRHTVDNSDPYPTVTLLISAYNEEQVISHKLENSLSIDYPKDKLQILVAVDGEEDRTKEIVLSYAIQGVEISFSAERTGKINALHRAVQIARGDIVVMTDANTYFAEDALRRLVIPMSDPKVGAVSGAKVISQQGDSLAHSEGLYWKYESFIKKQESSLGSCTGVCGEIFAIRRELFEPAPARIINDDFYLAMQILKKGYRVVYEAKALTIEKISLSAKDEQIRRSRIIAGRYQALWMGSSLLPLKRPMLVWQVFSHKFLRPLIPFAMMGALLLNLSAIIWPVKTLKYPFFQLSGITGVVFLILQFIFYGLAIWGNSRSKDKNNISSLQKLLYLPTFLVNSNMAAVSGLLQYHSGQQTNLWQRVSRRGD